MTRRLKLLSLLGLSVVWMPAAYSDEEAALDRLIADAGPDYSMQGEYVGTVRHGDREEAMGAQVVARSKGKLEAWLLRGGLPGAGWDGSEKLRYEKTTEGGDVVLPHAGGEHGDGALALVGGALEVRDAKGNVLGKLKRTVRKSPTLGKKPPKDAVVLFDGTTAEHFAQERGAAAEMTESGWLKLTRGSGGLTTKRAFGDCTLHLEFLLPFEPTHTDQGRANSGVYFQRRYEVQILDSFGLEGRENECGGIYSSGADPRVNMCLPPLVWQTYDVEFHAPKFDEQGKKTSHAQLTVVHNGVEVYKLQEVKHTTTASPERTEGPNPLPLYIQDHGHDLFFRNIWIVER